MPSASVHLGFASLARRLIDKHGRNITLVTEVNSGSDFDPVLAETTEVVVGVQTSYSANEVDGDLVRQDDRKYLIDSDVPITNAMTIRDGLDYSIKSVTEVQPGNTSILYKVQARL